MIDGIMRNTWLGVGTKSGGIVLFGGFENTTGTVMNMQNISDKAGFCLNNARLGLGLGWGSGLVAMCVFNCPDINQLHGTTNSDWGINLSLGGKWAAVAKVLANYKFFTTVAKIGDKVGVTNGNDIDSLRNGLHYLYNEYDMAACDGTPKVICFDTPAGFGAEVSVSYSFGGRIKIF